VRDDVAAADATVVTSSIAPAATPAPKPAIPRDKRAAVY
jgi:hypothetical protein